MDELASRLSDALPMLGGLRALIKFDLGADGQWLVDARQQGQPSLSQDDGEADCTIKITAENLVKLLDGKLDPMLAYTLGRIKVSGSMGVAMKLVSALG